MKCLYTKSLLAIILVSLLWECPLQAQSLDLVAGEYFIDHDPGYGQGTPISISEGTTAEVIWTISQDRLSAGFHILFVRFKDAEDNWGLSQSKPFYVGVTADHVGPPSFPLTQLEYFWDTDPGFGNGTSISVSGDSLERTEILGISDLSPGYHTLHIRAKNEENIWGMAKSKPFYIGPTIESAPIVQLEYFFNTDPGFGNGEEISISPADSVDLTKTLPTLGLGGGEHLLTVRAKNATGMWGIPAAKSFEVVVPFGITTRSPDQDAQDIPSTAEIAIAFNRALLQSQTFDELVTVTVGGQSVATDITAADSSLTVRPQVAWGRGVEVKVRVSGTLQDTLRNQPLGQDVEWSFFTRENQPPVAFSQSVTTLEDSVVQIILNSKAPP